MSYRSERKHTQIQWLQNSSWLRVPYVHSKISFVIIDVGVTSQARSKSEASATILYIQINIYSHITSRPYRKNTLFLRRDDPSCV